MRQSFVQVKTQDGTYKLVPKDEAHLHRAVDAPYVMNDIKEYKSPLDGSIISSRSHHRQHMREHGVIEVGNEKLTRPARKTYEPRGVREDLERALYKAEHNVR